jgi:hypothetical protein
MLLLVRELSGAKRRLTKFAVRPEVMGPIPER